MPEVPGADEVRRAMAAEINREFNRAVDDGRVIGTPKIAVADPTPTPNANAGPTPTPATAPKQEPTPQPAAAPAVVFDKDTHGLGKFTNLDELRKGYFNAVNALSATTDELSTLKANQPATVHPAASVTPTTVPAGVPGGSPRVNPAALNPIDVSADPVLAKLAEETGIGVELIASAVDRIATTRAEQIAAQVVDARLTPLQQMSEAENFMRTRYPEAVNHITEVGNFIKTNPEVADTVATLYKAGKPARAMEYAWKEYAHSVGLQTEKAMVANAAVAEEERTKARAEAGLPTSPNTGVLAARPNEQQPITREQLNELNAAAGTGLSNDHAATVRRRALLGSMLPPELRTWEQR